MCRFLKPGKIWYNVTMKTAAFAVGLFAACAVHGAETVRIAPDAHDAGPAFVAALDRVRAGGVIELAPGESRTVELEIPYRSFAMWDADMHFRVEEGWFKVWAGRNADDVAAEGRVYVK